MSLNLKIELPRDADAALRPLFAALADPTQLHLEAATALADGIKQHFDEENTSHKSAAAVGAEPGDFWDRMARGTVATADVSAGYVRMPREVAQRRFGGTIRPTGGKTYLAFPATASSYGKSPKDYPKDSLHFSFALNPFGVMQPALVRDDAQVGNRSRRVSLLLGKHTALGKDRTHSVVYFWLARQAVQKPDPSVLPSDDVAQAYVDHGITRHLKNVGTTS